MTLEGAADLQLLVSSVAASINNQAVKSLQDVGIKVATARVLISLLGRERARCAALARIVGMEATALSHLLRSMADQGLIVRERVKKDNRAVEVRLTAKGEKMAKLSHSALNSQSGTLCKGFTAEDVARLQQALCRLHDNIRPAKEGSAQ
jgi:DNA-binding MarR family transcriptional regulator